MPRLLLVDENASIQRSAEILLSGTDVELVTASSAEEALEKVASGTEFQVALIHAFLPGPMDGWQLLTHLRNHPATARMPIAMMAGVLKEVDPVQIAEAPIQGFLRKPIELGNLRDRLATLMATPVAEPPSPSPAPMEPVPKPPSAALGAPGGSPQGWRDEHSGSTQIEPDAAGYPPPPQPEGTAPGGRSAASAPLSDEPHRPAGPSLRSIPPDVVAARGGFETGPQALWVGTQKGLARWEKGAWSSVSLADSGLKDEQVYSLAETRAPDGSRILWVGTEAGLLQIHGREKRVFTLEDGLPSLFIYHLLETRDGDGGSSLWAATRGGGVARYKGGVWTGEGKIQGQPSPSVYHLKETRSKDGRRWLWGASFGNGILRRSLDREHAPWEVFDDQNLPQLPSNGILRMEEDRHGFLYAMTQRGVVRLRFEDPQDPARPTSLETFSTESGLPSPMCSFGASLRDSQGRIWVGTPHGAALLDPALETPVPPPTALVLERLLVSGRARQPLQAPSFPHRENSLTFEFAMPHLAKTGDAYFRTQMLGLEANPTDWTQATQREFAALAAGTYTFRVWGQDQLGREAPPLDFPFTIRPAPWKHPLALMVYLALVVLATLGAVQARHRALKRHNEELEAKVKERTLQLEERSRELAVSERRAQEASQAKSVFLSNMSHELRTPLNAILGFARLMRRGVGIQNQDRDHLDRIHRAGEHLLGLINDVLSISKIEAGKLVLNPVPFALRPFAQGIEEMMQVRAREKGLAFQVEIDPNLPEACLADEGKLRQVLINLLGNAIKFTVTGTVGLRFLAQEESVHFSVWDTGPGISPQELETLFQEFTQTETGRQSKEGTGLGLHISQAMVRLMGGELMVDSKLGTGTAFFFTLNLEPAQGQVRQAIKPRQILGLADGEPARKILVVDDQEDNRDLARELLEGWGFDVQVAEDGVSALEAWERWQPEAVFMDLRMPRLRGEAAATKLRELEGNQRRTAVFALSASVLGIDREQILAAGFDEFIQKPFHEHVLAEVLERYLGVRFKTEGLEAAQPEPPSNIDWQGFPEAWRPAFRQALLLGDLDEAQARLQELGEHPAVPYLELRIREFRTEEILQQMGE